MDLEFGQLGYLLMAISDLTIKQFRFVMGVCEGKTKTQAAIDAGFSSKHTYGTVSRLMRNEHVRAEIDRIMGEAVERAEVTVDAIVQELCRGAFADMGDYVEWGPKAPTADDTKVTQVTLKSSSEMPAGKRRAVVEVSESQHGVRIRLMNKEKCLELLGRYKAMFTEKVEVSEVGIRDEMKRRREYAEKMRAKLTDQYSSGTHSE